MPKFPKDAPLKRVIDTFKLLGFEIVRKREHIAMRRINTDKTITPLTLPNHKKIKAPTLQAICRQIGISREDFLKAYKKA